MTVRNMAATQNAYRNVMVNRIYGSQSSNRLSSGYRINAAADDAAGLAISEGMRGQIGGLGKAYENTQNGISMVQTAEGGLDTTGSILNRMRELAVQSSNGTYSADDRAQLNKEFQALKGEITRISDSTNYNGIRLLDGSAGGTAGQAGLTALGIDSISAAGNLSGQVKFTIGEENGAYSMTARLGDTEITRQLAAGDLSATFDFGGGNTLSLNFGGGVSGLSQGVIAGVEVQGAAVEVAGAVSASNAQGVTFQIGANGTADQRLSLAIGDMSALGLGIDELSISSVEGANSAISALTKAIDQNSGMRGTLGAVQNRLTHTASNLANTTQNLVASESNIRDLDMAKEMMNYTRRNLMLQASQSMMAQGMNLARSNMMALLMR